MAAAKPHSTGIQDCRLISCGAHSCLLHTINLRRTLRVHLVRMVPHLTQRGALNEPRGLPGGFIPRGGLRRGIEGG